MTLARAILSAGFLMVLPPPPLAAAEPPPLPAETVPAVENPACEASLAQLILPDLPALPDQSAKPVYKACDWTCTDRCDGYFQSCAAECPGFRGDPCLTDCRNGRISCYQGCGC